MGLRKRKKRQKNPTKSKRTWLGASEGGLEGSQELVTGTKRKGEAMNGSPPGGYKTSDRNWEPSRKKAV